MSLPNTLIFFLFITTFGTALSSIATFLSLGSCFHSIIILGLALSLKTLFAAILSYYSNYIIDKFNIKSTIIASQLFGCLALVILSLGFYLHQSSIVIFGIVLTGLPSALIAILSSIILKTSSTNDVLFRKYSSTREMVLGVAMLFAAILAPLLLLHFNLNYILLFDVITYVIGMIIIAILRVENVTIKSNEKSFSLLDLIPQDMQVKTFLLKSSASLLLVGLLPLLASSDQLKFTASMPELMRQWLWSIEELTMIFASLLYMFFVTFKKKRGFDFVIIFSSYWLIILMCFQYYSITIFSITVICLLTEISRQKFRDDLIVSAGEDFNLIKSYSALTVLQRNFMFFSSPIVLSVCFAYLPLQLSVLIIIFIQLVLYLIYANLRYTMSVQLAND